MNLGLRAEKRGRIIAGFTWIWLAGSNVVSAYFAFWVFPDIYAKQSEAVVDVYFQTRNPSEGITYYPNTDQFNRRFAHFWKFRRFSDLRCA